MKLTRLAVAIAAAACSASAALATTVTFDTSTSHTAYGITLGGSEMVWNGDGGGHVYNEYYANTASILFSAPVTLNSIDVNAMPWQGYTSGSSLSSNTLSAYDINNVLLWSSSFDLTNYTSWSNWLTININVSGVARLDSLSDEHWPSFDNLVFNEPLSLPAVPLPAGAPLAAGAFGALALLKRLRKAK